MLIWSVVIPFTQGPLSTVHWKMFCPTANPVTVVVGLLMFVIVPVPLTSVHEPTAGTITALPAMVAVPFTVHSDWSGPALAFGLPALYTLIRTMSNVIPLAQGPLFTVQRNSWIPTVRLVICVVGLFGFTMVPPDPLSIVHVPTAGEVTVLAFMNTMSGATGMQML